MTTASAADRFMYKDDDLIFTVGLPSGSKPTHDSVYTFSRFDHDLQSRWTSAADKGYFRYRLNITHEKVLPGKFGFFAQLNPERASNRRAPQDITSLSQPFEPSTFNFTKAKDTEILFRMLKTSAGPASAGDDRADFLLINVSPLEFCNSLLLPRMSECLPQVATAEGLRLAVEVVLLSNTPNLRSGFNSLCGFASVNHLHFHVYYLDRRMLLEHIGVASLAGACYELRDFPANAFVFQLPESNDVGQLVTHVHRLTRHLHSENTAHNVVVTRGTRLDGRGGHTVRVYVWARESSAGAKHVAAFNVAMCELFGHLNVKNGDLYAGLTEEGVAAALRRVCEGPFRAQREKVRRLFS